MGINERILIFTSHLTLKWWVLTADKQLRSLDILSHFNTHLSPTGSQKGKFGNDLVGILRQVMNRLFICDRSAKILVRINCVLVKMNCECRQTWTGGWFCVASVSGAHFGISEQNSQNKNWPFLNILIWDLSTVHKACIQHRMDPLGGVGGKDGMSFSLTNETPLCCLLISRPLQIH